MSDEELFTQISADPEGCPFCGEESVESVLPREREARVTIDCSCGYCDRAWTKLFTLSGARMNP